jgi:putative oxidoreductase
MAVWEPRVLSVLRIIVGLLYMEHGMSKLFNFPPGTIHPSFPGLLWFAGVLECFGGALIALGLLTRPVAFLLSGEMAIAYFMVHAPRSFFPLLNGGEGAVLYCFAFLYLACAGGGEWSLDRLRASMAAPGAAARSRA